MNGTPSILEPTDQQGVYFDSRTGEMIDARNFDDYTIYDTEQIVTPFAAGDDLNFFRSLDFPGGARKDLRFTNLTTISSLPSQWKMIVHGMSVKVLPIEDVPGSGLFPTPEDVLRILGHGVGLFTTGNQRTERELPLVMWEDPHGYTGIVSRTGPAASEFAIVNNGVPSKGAFVPLKHPIHLSEQLTFAGRVTFPDGLVLDGNRYIQMVLHGEVSIPLR